jgi:hypothetical protein
LDVTLSGSHHQVKGTLGHQLLHLLDRITNAIPQEDMPTNVTIPGDSEASQLLAILSSISLSASIEVELSLGIQFGDWPITPASVFFRINRVDASVSAQASPISLRLPVWGSSIQIVEASIDLVVGFSLVQPLQATGDGILSLFNTNDDNAGGTVDDDNGDGNGTAVAKPSLIEWHGNMIARIPTLLTLGGGIGALIGAPNGITAGAVFTFTDVDLFDHKLPIVSVDIALTDDIAKGVATVINWLADAGNYISTRPALTTKLPLLERSLNGFLHGPNGSPNWGDFIDWSKAIEWMACPNCTFSNYNMAAGSMTRIGSRMYGTVSGLVSFISQSIKNTANDAFGGLCCVAIVCIASSLRYFYLRMT